jgi:sugar phosphate permease
MDALNRKDTDLRKRWLYVLPAVFVTYSLAYLDRANYGFGAAAGLAATLHISGYQSSLLGALFFLGYFLPQIPAVALMQRTSARWMVFGALVAWGTFAALTGVVRSYPGLVADRVLLGVAESFVFPAMLILLTRWFTRAERSRANALMMLGNPLTVLWMSAVTGYLISATGWQMAFIVEGLMSVAWGVAWLVVIRDGPRKAQWMDATACAALEAELEREQLLVPRMSGLSEAFRQPNVVRLCINYFFWSLGIYGFVLWLPVVVRNATGAAMGRTGLLAAAPYLAAVLLMLLVSYWSDRSARRREFVWPFLVTAGVALAGSYFSVERSFPLAFACLIVGGSCMYAPYGAFFAMVPELLPRNVVGETLALINCCGALGGFFGTWLVGVLQAYTGSSQAGFLLMSLSVVLSGVLLLGMKQESSVQPMRREEAA